MIIKKLVSHNYLGLCKFLSSNKSRVSEGREIEQEKINRSIATRQVVSLNK